MTERKIPTFEDVSATYANLSGRRDALRKRQTEVSAEILEVHASIHGQGSSPTTREDRVRALIDGTRMEVAADRRDQLSALCRERDDLKVAVEELDIALADERRDASRVISSQFNDEYRALATEFFGHIAAASEVHVRYGELIRQFARAGVEPTTMTDFGRELLGHAGLRNDTAGIELRSAVSKGYLKPAALPEAFR